MAARVARLAGDAAEFECFTPHYIARRKHEGQWCYRASILFPGYLFLVSNEIESIKRRLTLSTSFIRLLGTPACDFTLCPEEAAFVRSFADERHVVGMSEGEIVDGVTHVYAGPLRGHERMIRKIDRHKALAWVDIGQKRERLVRVGLEVPRKT